MTQPIENEIHALFIQNKWTLSLAESCTGGALSARLTRLPGCSNYFLGSVIPYSNQLKINILGVKQQVVQSQGAVSEEVVKQMAEGMIKLTGSDYSLAISGIAGPGGGSLEKPVGTVCGAVARKDGGSMMAWSFHFEGNRQEIIEKSVNTFLNQLWLLLKNRGRMYG